MTSKEFKNNRLINNENFISLFLDNSDFLIFCIKEICNEKKIEVDCNNLLLISNLIPIENLGEKFKQVDLVASNDSNVINIEANNVTGKITRKKNASYLMKMYSEDTSKGEKYDVNKKFLQINFDNGNTKKFGLLTSASILTMEKHPVVDNFYLLYLDVAKCYKKFYNLVNEGKESEIDNYIRIGAFFYSNDPNELDTILGDMLDIELRRRVINKVKELYTMNEDYSLTPETIKKYGEFLSNGWRHEFTEEGRIAGIKENAIKMIKSMLKNNIDVKTVAKVSNKSVQEIEKIEKSMK